MTVPLAWTLCVGMVCLVACWWAWLVHLDTK